LLVKLDTINDRTEAKTLRGQPLTVPQEESEPLPEGYYYHFQILDMEVQTDEGERLGIIKEILETGSNDVYVVGLSGQRGILIPAIEDVILDVDLKQNLMTVQLPDGLR
jgi:16S rRNA processing protein RimM